MFLMPWLCSLARPVMGGALGWRLDSRASFPIPAPPTAPRPSPLPGPCSTPPCLPAQRKVDQLVAELAHARQLNIDQFIRSQVGGERGGVRELARLLHWRPACPPHFAAGVIASP